MACGLQLKCLRLRERLEGRGRGIEGKERKEKEEEEEEVRREREERRKERKECASASFLRAFSQLSVFY